MKRFFAGCVVLCLLAATGCAPAVIGAGAAGAYRVGTDQRTIGSMWNDTTINTKVKTALLKDSRISGMNIDVDTIERNVTLSGNVDSAAQVALAAEIAAKVPGVKSVKNLLGVGTKSIGESIDDTVVGTRVKSRLAGEPGIRSLNVDVDVNKGVVTLTGIVGNEDQRSRVVEIAGQTPGVLRVVDNLTLR